MRNSVFLFIFKIKQSCDKFNCDFLTNFLKEIPWSEKAEDFTIDRNSEIHFHKSYCVKSLNW